MRPSPIPAAVCAAVALLASGAARAQGPAVSEVLQAPRPAGGEYFGLYVVGKKVGYAYMHVGLAPGSKDKVVATENTVMRANVGGRDVERIFKETKTYEAKPNGRLLSFTIEQRGDGGDQTLEGTATPTGLTVIRKRPSMPNEILSQKPPKEIVEDADQVRVALLRGKAVEGLMVDPTDLQTYRVKTTVLPPFEATVGGVKLKLRRASTISEKEQVPVEATMTEDGRIIEIKFGSNMAARAEPEAEAKRLDRVELFGLTRVTLPKEPPASVRSVPGKMTLVFDKLPARFIRDTDRQKFKKLPQERVEVVITAAPMKPEKRRSRPLPDPAGGANLKSDLAIESDKPEIKEAAKKIIGSEKDALTAAELIIRWVYANMERAYGYSADRATDVLRQRKGDCTEHALLAVALLRASGIPSKRIDGVIYDKDSNGVPALLWHEWVAAYVGEWVYLDPAWDQPLADATHFAVGEETQAEIAPLIGELKVLDVR